MRCALDSCLAQTLQEIEIIAVNDGSPDGSQAILEEYAARYPGKVIALRHEINRGPALARETGFRHARAPYVLFLDPDDAIDPRLCQITLETALRGDHDLVGYYYAIRNEYGRTMKVLPSMHASEQRMLVRHSCDSFCMFLFHRSLLENKDVFIPMFFEDGAVIAAIIADARSVAYTDAGPMYFYRQHSDSIINSFAVSREKRRDFLRQNDVLWQHAKGPFKPDIAWRIMIRTQWWLTKHPFLYTDIIAHAKAMEPLYAPYLPEDAQALHQAFRRSVLALPDVPPIPFTLYLNGFAPDARRRLAEAQAACPLAQFVLLDEGCCDLSAAPETVRHALAEGRHEDAARWFAMTRIAQEGGFYAASGSCMLPAADALRYHQLVFCWGVAGVSLHFFGGAAGDPRWAQLAGALIAPGESPERRMADLLMQLGATLSGEEESLPDGLIILSPARSMLRSNTSACFCGSAAQDGSVTLPGEIYQALTESLIALNDAPAELRRLREANEAACRDRDRYLSERDEARHDRTRILNAYRSLKQSAPKPAGLLDKLRCLLHKGGH